MSSTVSWVPSLAGKLDMIPGRTNVYRFAARKPGNYRGQCAEYCGAQHALMAFYVVAMPQPEFDAWYAGKAVRPKSLSFRSLPGQGTLCTVRLRCVPHRARGTEANGQLGPDLTHVGGRISIAAGTFPSNQGTFAGWIASAQHLKPGKSHAFVRHAAGRASPRYSRLSGEPQVNGLIDFIQRSPSSSPASALWPFSIR